MEPGVFSQELSPEARDKAAERHRGRPVRPGEHGATQRDAERAVELMESVGRTEKDIASTLRAIARDDASEAGVRRRELAETAMAGARAAAERAGKLQRLVSWQARHDDVAALLDSVHYAGQLLSDLAPAEEAIAATLAKLASKDSPELAGEQRRLAREALVSARSARNRARALRRLAQTGRQWLPDDHQPAQHGRTRT
jgi:hypothetical protein